MMPAASNVEGEGVAVPPILSVNNIEVVYDHIALVLKGVSFSVPQGGIVALLGANGAGKTTTLRAISNMLKAERGDVTKGSVMFAGERVDRLTANDLVRRGCIQVLEGRRCFAHLTIEENLLAGAYTRPDGAAAIRRDLEKIYETFPRLRQRRASIAGYVSGGEQQMCAIGRGLMAAPRLLMIDELSLGLAPKVVDELVETLSAINRGGTAILVVEQDVATALALAQRGFVLDTGRIVASDSTRALAESPEIRKAYLGAELELAG